MLHNILIINYLLPSWTNLYFWIFQILNELMEEMEPEAKNRGIWLFFSNCELHRLHWICDQFQHAQSTYNHFDVVGRKYTSLVSTFPSVPICIYFFQKINNLSRSEAQIISLFCMVKL